MILVQKHLENQGLKQIGGNITRQVDFDELEDLMHFGAVLLAEDIGNRLQFGEEDDRQGVSLEKDVV